MVPLPSPKLSPINNSLSQMMATRDRLLAASPCRDLSVLQVLECALSIVNLDDNSIHRRDTDTESTTSASDNGAPCVSTKRRRQSSRRDDNPSPQ